MADKLHGALTDADGIHEPKGIEGASSNEIYVADGAGSGSWTSKQAIVNPSFICVYLDDTQPTERTFTQTGTILPFTLDYLTANSNNFTYNNVTKEITYTGTSDIFIQIVASITLSKGAAGNDTEMLFYIQKDTGSGFITQNRTKAGDTLEDNSLSNICVACVGQLSNGDKLRMAVESSEAVTVNAENINITISGITI